MKYNIVTVATNSHYEPFLILFVNSLFKNTNVDLLNNLYILEKNINLDTKNSLSKLSDKIIFENKEYFLKLNINNLKGNFSDEWRQSVFLKTNYIFEKVRDSDCTTILIDLDSFFIKNFHTYINLNYDIQLCKRPSGIIASYISFNNKEKSLTFIDEWIKLIVKINEDVVETTSLNMMSLDKKYEIELVDYKKIGFYYSIDEITSDTSIFHLKGCSAGKNVQEDITNRINRLSSKYDVNSYLKI